MYSKYCHETQKQPLRFLREMTAGIEVPTARIIGYWISSTQNVTSLPHISWNRLVNHDRPDGLAPGFKFGRRFFLIDKLYVSVWTYNLFINKANMFSTAKFLVLLSGLCCRYMIQAAPLANLLPRQYDAECAEAGQTYRSSCWDKHDLAKYLTDPVTGWNITTQTCGTRNDPAGCDTTRTCLKDEAWSTCYLRIATGNAGRSCLSLGGEDCDPMTLLSTDATGKNDSLPHLDPSIRAQARYIVKSIYRVESFFESYFNGPPVSFRLMAVIH